LSENSFFQTEKTPEVWLFRPIPGVFILKYEELHEKTQSSMQLSPVFQPFMTAISLLGPTIFNARFIL